jgi:hypothetical protein
MTNETRTRPASELACGLDGQGVEGREPPFGPRSSVAIPGEISLGVFGTVAEAGVPGAVLAPCINVPRLRPSAGLGVLPMCGHHIQASSGNNRIQIDYIDHRRFWGFWVAGDFFLLCACC